jgi:predicted ribonuclease YlaK
MKLALQRIGDDAICILDGDSNTQVDLEIYAGAHNGMRRVSEIFRGQDFYGEVTLPICHRSKIAIIADRL